MMILDSGLIFGPYCIPVYILGFFGLRSLVWEFIIHSNYKPNQ